MTYELPDELLLQIFTYLSSKELLSCACVCWRWHSLSGGDILWRSRAATVNIKAAIEPETLTLLAQQTSWKFVYMCRMLLKRKCLLPDFWDDVPLFLDLQNCRTAVRRWCPCNGLFWLMLQLELGPTGVVSPLARPNPSQGSVLQLQYSLIILTRHYGAGLVLQKLREIATLPSAAYLSSPGPRITSSLLLRLSQNCLGSDLGDRHCSWPPPTSGYLNWKEYFTQPVQDTVTLALRTWTTIAGQCEWHSVIAGRSAISWLCQLAKESFWVGNRSEVVTAIAESASVKACSLQLAPSFGLFYLKSITSQSTISFYTRVSLPQLNILLDKDITPRIAAERLSRWSFRHFHDLPRMDLTHYMVSEPPEFSQLPLNRLLLQYQDKLAHTVTSHCMSAITLKNKAASVHRVLDICVQLRGLRDFTTLKALWAAVGAVMAQQHLTHVSWNDIKFKDCEKFGELRELLCNKDCYAVYLRYLRALREEAFVPYLPAHRQFCQQRLVSRDGRCRQGMTERRTMQRVPLMPMLALSSEVAVPGDHLIWRNRACDSGIRPCELFSVDHLLSYKL